MGVVAIELRDEAAHICADRRLAFQVLTAFGAKTADGSSSEVLRDDGDVKLVRFITPLKLLIRERRLVTEETVTLNAPREIGFELERAFGLLTPMKLLRERFVLDEVGGCCRLTYKSRFGLCFGRVGWLVGMALVRFIMQSFMKSHLAELKETIEAKAKRSRVYPAPAACALD